MDEEKWWMIPFAMVVFGLLCLSFWGYSKHLNRQREHQCVQDHPESAQYIKDCSTKQSYCACVGNAVQVFNCVGAD